MAVDRQILDDLARIAGSAFGTVAGMRDEIEAQMRQQFDRVLARMDLVTREEFEAVRMMAATARAEQEAMAERLAALEARMAQQEAAADGTHEARVDSAANAADEAGSAPPETPEATDPQVS